MLPKHYSEMSACVNLIIAQMSMRNGAWPARVKDLTRYKISLNWDIETNRLLKESPNVMSRPATG
jgi:hypothetical protein